MVYAVIYKFDDWEGVILMSWKCHSSIMSHTFYFKLHAIDEPFPFVINNLSTEKRKSLGINFNDHGMD